MSDKLNWAIANAALIAAVANLLFITTAFTYMYLRAGSILAVRDRLWRMLGGKSTFNTEALQHLKDDKRELEHFRFEFGIPALTMKEALLFEDWIYKNDLPLQDVTLAKKYIEWGDFNAIRIKSIKIKPRRIASGLFAVVFYVAMILSFALAVPSHVMIKLPDTEYFYISKNNIKFSIFKDQDLDTKSCNSTEKLLSISKETDLAITTLNSLCEDLPKERTQERIKSLLTGQRIALLTLGFFSLFSFYLVVRYSAKIHATRRLIERLKDN